MALKDIFTMVKADRYTVDGCEELNKAREAEIEDRTYQIGEISQKTGLQKTANGWVKPPKEKVASKSGGLSERLKYSTEQSAKNMRSEDLKKHIDNLKDPSHVSARTIRNRDDVRKVYETELAKRSGGSKSNPYEMTEAEKKQAMNDPGTRMSQKYDALMGTKAGTPEREKALAEYTKERDSYKESQGAEAAKKYPVDPTRDSAPRILTGDTKIRVRK